MKDIIVTDDIKMEVINYFCIEGCEEANFYMNEAEDGLFKFYYYCMINDIDLCDADRYANLNTILGYDIGLENFRNIDYYLWGEKEWDLLELTCNHASKELIKETAEVLGIDIDFSKWREEEPKSYIYYV